MLALLHRGQNSFFCFYKQPLFWKHSLYANPWDVPLSRLGSVYSPFALQNSQFTLSLKWIFLLKNSLLNLATSLSFSCHATVPASHPASPFQRFQCQIDSLITLWHPAVLVFSHTHAVLSPAHVYIEYLLCSATVPIFCFVWGNKH